MICQVYFGTSICPQLTFPHDFCFLFLLCSSISSHHCCKEQQYCVKDAGVGFKRHILFLAVSQKYMWPQAIELRISVLWLLNFKKGDSSASLGNSEKCVHVISLSKGAVMWTIWETSTKFFPAFSYSCTRTPLFFLISLRLFHYHLQYPDGSNIFILPNPYQVPIQQFRIPAVSPKVSVTPGIFVPHLQCFSAPCLFK